LTCCSADKLGTITVSRSALGENSRRFVDQYTSGATCSAAQKGLPLNRARFASMNPAVIAVILAPRKHHPHRMLLLHSLYSMVWLSAIVPEIGDGYWPLRRLEPTLGMFPC